MTTQAPIMLLDQSEGDIRISSTLRDVFEASRNLVNKGVPLDSRLEVVYSVNRFRDAVVVVRDVDLKSKTVDDLSEMMRFDPDPSWSEMARDEILRRARLADPS